MYYIFFPCCYCMCMRCYRLAYGLPNNPGNNPNPLIPPATPYIGTLYAVSPMKTLPDIYPIEYSPIASELTFYGAITGLHGLPIEAYHPA